MVIMIEYDQWNGANEFNGTAGWTQGDWITGSSIPKVNAEDPDRGYLYRLQCDIITRWYIKYVLIKLPK